MAKDGPLYCDMCIRKRRKSVEWATHFGYCDDCGVYMVLCPVGKEKVPVNATR